MKRELKQRFVWVLSVIMGVACIGCVKPCDKIKPVDKISKKKGGWR